MARNAKNRRVLPAQEPLWERHYRRFLRQVRDPEAAADLLQQLRLRVHERITRHGEPEALERFAAVAARSVFVDWLREKRRRPETIPQDELAQEPADAAVDAHATLEKATWLALVRSELALATSSETLRAIVALWDEPGHVVAGAVGTTIAAVRTYRYKLQRRLAANPRLRTLALEMS